MAYQEMLQCITNYFHLHLNQSKLSPGFWIQQVFFCQPCWRQFLIISLIYFINSSLFCAGIIFSISLFVDVSPPFHRVTHRSSRPEMFLGKGVVKIRSKFAEEHPYRSAISIKFFQKLYWNRTSAWGFSCKFAAYLQNTFF